MTEKLLTPKEMEALVQETAERNQKNVDRLRAAVERERKARRFLWDPAPSWSAIPPGGLKCWSGRLVSTDDPNVVIDCSPLPNETQFYFVALDKLRQHVAPK